MTIWTIVIVVAIALVAFAVGYFTGGEEETVARPAAVPPSAATPAKPAPKEFPAPKAKPAEPSPGRAAHIREHEAEKAEFEKRRRERELERERKTREAEVERLRREELPDELRYKHRPKLPKHLQERIDADRERRHLEREMKRHPERAEELKGRLEELEKRFPKRRRISNGGAERSASDGGDKTIPPTKRKADNETKGHPGGRCRLGRACLAIGGQRV